MNTMKKTKAHKKWGLVASIALAAMILASCAGSNPTTVATTTAATTTQSTSAATTTTATTEAPKPTGILKKISPEEGKELLEKTPDAVLLDVRFMEEYEEIRIPGSILIPVTELADRLDELPKDAQKPIVVYCRSGNRSATAAGILIDAGFPLVYDMGGINNWPFETEKG